ncbi:MAG: type IV pilus twitching motility protein PilT [Myxococcaceae bacterium]
MARLDSVIDRLLQDRATELVFETGNPAVIRGGARGEVVVVRQKLSTPQIIGAFAEILPDALKSQFPGNGPLSFPYSASQGGVLVRFHHQDGKVKAVVVPTGQSAPEEKLELATPADMMGMAAQAVGGFQTPATPRPAAGSPAARPIVTPPPPAAAQQAAPSAAHASSGGRKAVPKPAADARAAIDQLLAYMLDGKASDIHLSSENPPMLRVDGDIVPLPEYGVLSPERLQSMLWTITPERNKSEYNERKDTDYAYETSRARFRVNIFCDRKGIGAVMRQIPNDIRTAEELGLSKFILDLCFLTKGLVLVTGPTGSGKSTTLAAMIDFINRNREDHIITIEDPIEFVHPNKKCLVNQRQISEHTQSFKNALRAALREDPDIVLVGELRDLETIAIAIETAETGHLVFGTLHTNTASSTVDRIIDQFPTDRQEQIRMMLSESLKGVISQTLCKKIGGGRVAALEVLIGTGSVSNLIREGKTFQLPSIMQTGKSSGMQTLNDVLLDHVKKGLVAPLEAYMKAVAKNEMKTALERAGLKFELPGTTPAA